MTEQAGPWKVLETRRILDTPYLRIRSERVAVPGGVIIPDYYIIENRGWVGIVPYTPDGYFLLNRQYKHGIGCDVLEFPAGTLDDDTEEPVETAHRELMEETGYSSDNMEPLAEMLANPTGASTRVWWYLAHNARKTGEQKIDPVEVIENILVTPAELLRLVHSGEFAMQGQIAAAYLALERLGYLQTNFERSQR
jgi:8-oxo-dGTP pyrophosphatase MutT (NUDIX family)